MGKLYLYLLPINLAYSVMLFMTCLSIVMVLHYLYRAAVNALFSLVVLLIMYCVVKLHFILLFEQIKKQNKIKKLTENQPTRLRCSQ